ncbi:lipoate--protein ligase family protein [Alkalibacterium iburiense]|uniref:Octanoyl-[GcvH]:protein N-octanoyltransferase n=1 Tax=Alkalibacterium iburiense TaxID=290589 RepID=A0ABN0XG98_9LACT
MTDFLHEATSPFLLFDELPSSYTEHPFSPFALTDAFIQEAGEKKQPIMHFWTTSKQIILGMLDTKLPYLNDALRVFSSYDYAYMVRNSGGLAVVSDEGVLNFSIFFPEGEARLSINEGYERMHHILQEAFASYGKTIHAYEISDSYCPGDFDLSIDGKKIAGIAQRRLRGGIAIMIYLSVHGDQKKRADMIRAFYDVGLKQKETKWDFPPVRPEVMTTLEEALGVPLTIEQTKENIQHVFTKAGIELIQGDLTPTIQKAYEEGFEKMVKRNNKMLPSSPHSANG